MLLPVLGILVSGLAPSASAAGWTPLCEAVATEHRNEPAPLLMERFLRFRKLADEADTYLVNTHFLASVLRPLRAEAIVGSETMCVHSNAGRIVPNSEARHVIFSSFGETKSQFFDRLDIVRRFLRRKNLSVETIELPGSEFGPIRASFFRDGRLDELLFADWAVAYFREMKRATPELPILVTVTGEEMSMRLLRINSDHPGMIDGLVFVNPRFHITDASADLKAFAKLFGKTRTLILSGTTEALGNTTEVALMTKLARSNPDTIRFQNSEGVEVNLHNLRSGVGRTVYALYESFVESLASPMQPMQLMPTIESSSGLTP